MLLFFVASLVFRCNICCTYNCVTVLYDITSYPYIIVKQNVLKGKVYIYAFHLRKGGVMQPHIWNIL